VESGAIRFQLELDPRPDRGGLGCSGERSFGRSAERDDERDDRDQNECFTELPIPVSGADRRR
jgi:hypothetical protein